MKFLLSLVSVLSLFCVSTEVSASFDNLIEVEKEACVESLAAASTQELWAVFLDGQAELFFEPEFACFGSKVWWQTATSVLDLGCGNGGYLNLLSTKFHHTSFKGVDHQEQHILQARERYAGNNLSFEVGDVHVFNESLAHSADIVFFRF